MKITDSAKYAYCSITSTQETINIPKHHPVKAFTGAFLCRGSPRYLDFPRRPGIFPVDKWESSSQLSGSRESLPATEVPLSISARAPHSLFRTPARAPIYKVWCAPGAQDVLSWRELCPDVRIYKAAGATTHACLGNLMARRPLFSTFLLYF